MKRICNFVVVIMLCCFLCSCGNGAKAQLKDFEGLSLAPMTVAFDGNNHSLTISGTVPEGTDIAWTGNDARLPGSYSVSVKLSKIGYRTATLNTMLTITALEFSGLSFADIAVTHGQTITPTVVGAEGASVEFSYFSGETKLEQQPSSVGQYKMTAVVTMEGYASKTLTANLTISNNLFDSTIALTDKSVIVGNDYNFVVDNASKIPAGATISDFVYYNKGSDVALATKPTAVGEYTVKVTISKEGYASKTLVANLTISYNLFDSTIALTDKSVEFGESYTFVIDNASKIPAGATTSDFTYYNKGSDVALLSKPTAVGVYTVKVTISKEGYTTKVLTANLTIYASKITSIALTNLPLSPNLPVGMVWTFGINAMPEAHEVATFTYSSSDPSVATVKNNGEVTAVKAGSTTIKAVVDGYTPEISSSYELTVFADTRVAEDFETVFTLGSGAGNSGRGKVPFAAGVSNANITLSLTEDTAELPFGGSGKALKISQTGATGYNTTEFAFGNVTSGEKYELRYCAKLISGAHPMIFQLSMGGDIITRSATSFGSNVFHFTANASGALTLKLAQGTASDYVITLDNLAIEKYDNYRISLDGLINDRRGNTMTEKTDEDGQFSAVTVQGNRNVNIQNVTDLTGADLTKASVAGINGKALCFLSNYVSGNGYKKVEMSWALPSDLAIGRYTFSFRTSLLNGNHSRLIGIKGSGQTESAKAHTADGIQSISFEITAATKTLIISVADGVGETGSRLLMDDLSITASK